MVVEALRSWCLRCLLALELRAGMVLIVEVVALALK